MQPEIELTAPQRAALRSVFAPYANKLERVGVYGSRAQGLARPGSDVDLVIYGAVTAIDITQMRNDLEDSDLSIFSNVTAYNAISYPPLKEQIDKWMRPLFERAELAN